MIVPALPIRRRSTMISSWLIIAVLIMVAALLAAPARPAVAEPAAPLPGYELAWSDEFDGTKPDGTGLATDDWYFRESEKAICSNSPDNVSVSGGALQIALKREDRNGMPYTCGGVISKQWFGYGYYETRAKLWGDQGFHSALWTTGLSDAMPDTPGYQGPNNRINEIDGFEIDSHAPTKIAHHSHWFTPRHIGNQGGLYEGPDSSDGFHSYGFEWLPNEIRYYVDGTLARVQPFAGPHGLQSIWLTTLGYTAPVDETDLPGVTSWDYFRYYAPIDDGADSTPDSVIVDNGDPGYAETGGWTGTGEAFGFQDRETRRATEPGATARWTPELTKPGSYEVAVWNPSFLSTGQTAARYTVEHAGGRTEVVVDQVTAGQRWIALGTYQLTPGTGHGVSAAGDPTGKGTLRADAARFTPAGADAGDPETGELRPPTRVHGTVTSTPATGDATVTWTWRESTGPRPAGYHVYLDGQRVSWQPVRRTSFTMREFRPGQRHRLTVTAVDSTGRESAPATPAPVRTPADTRAPAAPTGLEGEAANGSAILYWNQNTEVDLLGYHVYADGKRVTDEPVGHPANPEFTRLGYQVAGLTNGTEHELDLRAVDLSGHESVAAKVTVEPLPMVIIGVADDGYTEQGTWTASSVPGWLSSKTRTSNVPAATAQWRPTLAQAAAYEVYAWVPRVAGNSTPAARFTVTHAGGATAIDLDQTAGAGGWVRLGRFDFTAGADGLVTASNAAGRSYLRTNTVKFIPVG